MTIDYSPAIQSSRGQALTAAQHRLHRWTTRAPEGVHRFRSENSCRLGAASTGSGKKKKANSYP
ncbi:MAG: hypothetical protein OQK99_02820, partial [Gammaproteobacteria bacterium]|nr:hypothetical protein [Gammaproteobacteria bacterium]